MKDCPKVSVLMLTYNQEDYIDEAIRSVMLQQTDFDFELVIGNDASTDRTAERCQAWKLRYPERIMLVDREQNLGLIGNFMATYDLCRGTYIAICEGDDFWTDKTKLQRQVDFLDAHPDFSTCFHRVVNYYADNGTKSLSNGRQQTDTDICDLARSNYISNVSALFRRGLFGRLPDWFPQVSTYDYAIHMLNAAHGRIHYMKRPMAVYRQHSRAIWSRTEAYAKMDIGLKVRELLIEHFRETRPDVSELLRDAHTRFSLNELYHCRQEGRTDEAERLERRLLALRPEWDHAEVERRLLALRPDSRTLWKRRAFGLLKKARAVLLLFRPPAPHPLNGETRFPTGKRISENKKPDFHTEIAFSKTKKRNSRPGNALSEKKSPFPDRENHFLKRKNAIPDREMHFPKKKARFPTGKTIF